MDGAVATDGKDDGGGRRTGEAGAIGLGIVALLFLTSAPVGSRLSLLPAALVLFVWLLSLWLAVECAIRRALGRPAPFLPFTTLRLGVRAAIVLATVFLAIAVVREGLLAPLVHLDIEWNEVTTTPRVIEEQVRRSEPLQGAPPVVPGAARFLRCDKRCTPSGGFCRSFEAYLVCDSDTSPDGPLHAGMPIVPVDVRVDATLPFCMVPFYKSGTARFTSTTTFHLAGPLVPDGPTRTLELTGEIDQRGVGLGSCSAFRQRLGYQAARMLAGRMQQVVDAD